MNKKTPDGWPNDTAGQFDIRNVTVEDTDRWEETARMMSWYIKPGEFNYPSVIRNLCAEIRRLKKNKST